MSVLRKITWEQLQSIFYYVGNIITWVSILMIFPVLVSLSYGEWNIVVDFVLSMSAGLSLGFALQLFPKSARKLSWLEGMTIASLTWILMVFISALPFWLSGFYGSYLDAVFDAMSGYTTTGLTLVVDLDHLPYGVNMWRQLICFLGGQGVVVLVLTFFLKNAPGSFKLYVGEAKSDKIFPNVIHTARAIWYIGLVFLAIGTLSLGGIAVMEGMRPDRALLHGLWIFLAGWSGAGYTPQSQSILYYHSTAFELVALSFMLLGSVNFALHFAMLSNKRKEFWQNIETKTYLISMVVLLVLLYAGLNRLNLYSSAFNLFRKGFFQLISAHTGTGYVTVYSADFAYRWGGLAVFVLILAMLFGGMTGSTAGGLKMLRVGVMTKGVIQDVKRLFFPESAVVVTKFHFYTDMVLNDQHVRSALTIIILYILTFAVGTGVGTLYGYPLTDAAFESASATGNVGLSAGITAPAMPVLMKIVYILIMYIARLEFLSVFALIAIIAAGVTRKARKVVGGWNG